MASGSGSRRLAPGAWCVLLVTSALSLSLSTACAEEDEEGPSLTINVGGDSGEGGQGGDAPEKAGSGGDSPGAGGQAGEPSGGASAGVGGSGGVAGSEGGKAGAGAGGAGGGGGTGTAGQGGTGSAGKGGAAAGSGGSGVAGTGGSAAGAGGTGGASGGGGSTPLGTCPEGMAYVDLEQAATVPFCIDRWEAQVEVLDDTGVFVLHSPYETLDALTAAGTKTRAVTHEAVVPQGYISGKQAQTACEGAGKRLCTYDEHLDACGGPTQTIWPYGDTRVPGECNEGRAKHPVIEMFGPNASFDNTELNDPGLNQLPDSLAETGAYTGCVSTFGAYDLAGNLHEWIGDPAGTFVGGFYVDAVKNYPGCLYKTTAHDFSYHDYSTGFRCCLDAPTTAATP
jgi:hypothetical protein